MKKIILFIWFGDQKPVYIQWTLENFRKMNPGWEICYVEYSNIQLKNYKSIGDPVLDAIAPNKCFSFWVDSYKTMYLKMHKDELVIYCDLDCFPIAPFDNFILYEKDKDVIKPSWYYNLWKCNNINIKDIGIFAETTNNGIYTINRWDAWCKSNRTILLDRCIQIYKKTQIGEQTLYYKGMIMDKYAISEYNKRSKDFHEMKIELGDNFCLPQFTPIEHYYSFERDKLNKGIEFL